MRTLNHTLTADGVVYDVGTVESELPKDLEVDGRFFDGDADPSAATGDGERIASDYGSHNVGPLKAEVAARNDGLVEGDAGFVVVGGKGNKDDLVAALEANDQASQA